MAGIRRGFVDSDFGQMHYRIAGECSAKPSLICLHQSPKSSREFIKIIELASDDRCIIAIDSPGHGESYVPTEKISIADYARAIWSALGSLNLGQVDLLGHHTGSQVAAEMALLSPENVNKIVMVSALTLSENERLAFMSEFQPIPLDEQGTRFKHIWEQALKYRGRKVTLEQLAFSVTENTRAGEAYEWGHEAAFNHAVIFAERLAMLSHFITVLNPKDMLFGYTPRVALHLQNGTVIDHPEWGFGFMDTDTESAVQAIKAALA